MPSFDGIFNVINRIQSIQSKFNLPNTTPTPGAGSMPFDMALKKAMGSGQVFSPVSSATAPDSLQALLNSMGISAQPVGGSSSSIAASANQRLAEFASKWNGSEFKPGQTARCADFVSTMIRKSGIAPKNFKHELNCWELQKQGSVVKKKDLKPGDIVYFGWTYLPVDFTHVGIYLGNGKFVHRPTANKPVRIDNINNGYYAQKYCGARRITG